MLAGFGAAYNQFAAEEFLVVQFGHRPLGFIDRLHLHESETFRSLVVSIADNFRVLNVPDAIEELEQIALARVER